MKRKILLFVMVMSLLVGCNTVSSEKPAVSSARIENVPLVLQYPELPRGCEITSLAMLLQHRGYEVDKMGLAEEIVYEAFESNGLKGNMHDGFVGAMDTLDEDGLGVYVEPIVKLARKYASFWKVKNLTGKNIESLYKAVEAGNPVWVLTNARFKELPDDQFLTWETEEGPMQVTYRQHSVVITGYDESYVYVNDPLKSQTNIALNRGDFEAAWVQMGSQAMYISE